MIKRAKKPKVRNYSFQKSRRMPEEKMTEMNGIKIPSLAGSCYHAIICTLAQHKNKFVPWKKIFELTERYMCQYGGDEAWEKFKKKGDVKDYEKRIQENTHALTRTGKHAYGYRLHERGMTIYYFKDGAVLLTGGKFTRRGTSYNVKFPDGRGLQMRYRGTTMTFKEFRRFLEMGFIDKNGKILNAEQIHILRNPQVYLKKEKKKQKMQGLQVCVTLKDGFDQDTAIRLESVGLSVENALNNELIGNIASQNLSELRKDPDVIEVEIAGI